MNKRILLLGSGELGAELTLSFSRLGCSVIACDRYAGAPAHQVAHQCQVFDMQDPEVLKAKVIELKPDIIVPEIEAISPSALESIQSEFPHITVIPNTRAVRACMDRWELRQIAQDVLKLPVALSRLASTEEEALVAAKEVGFPCLFKPLMSSSGKGQIRVSRPEDCFHSFKKSVEGARGSSSSIIVEQFIEFDFEITLLTIATHLGEVHFCKPIGHVQSKGDFILSWQPQPMSKDTLESAQSQARAMVLELGGVGLFGVEFFVKKNQVFFSELSPRPHDTGLVTLKSQFLSEFDLHARATLGLPLNMDTLNYDAHYVACAAIKSQVESPTSGPEQLRDLSFLLQSPTRDLRWFHKPMSYPGRRLGVVTDSSVNLEILKKSLVEDVSQIKLSF